MNSKRGTMYGTLSNPSTPTTPGTPTTPNIEIQVSSEEETTPSPSLQPGQLQHLIEALEQHQRKQAAREGNQYYPPHFFHATHSSTYIPRKYVSGGMVKGGHRMVQQPRPGSHEANASVRVVKNQPRMKRCGTICYRRGRL